MTVDRIAAQPTDWGRTVHALTIWNDHLYLSYGDVNANTGPIDIIRLDLADPAATPESVFTAETEQTIAFRPVSSTRAYVPYLDPRQGIGDPEGGSYAVTDDGGATWSLNVIGPPYTEHVVDMAETSNGDIFALGLSQIGDPGTAQGEVWRSDDGGATWASSLRMGEYFYYNGCFAQVGDTLYVSDAGAGLVWTWDGETWTSAPPTSAEPSADLAAPDIAFQAFGAWVWPSIFWPFIDPAATLTVEQVARLNAVLFEAIDTNDAGNRPLAVSADGQHLYLLASSNQMVTRYDQQMNATQLFRLEEQACSLAVDESRGLLWYGTRDGHLSAVTLP